VTFFAVLTFSSGRPISSAIAAAEELGCTISRAETRDGFTILDVDIPTQDAADRVSLAAFGGSFLVKFD